MPSGVFLFDLASRQSQWLSVRQSAISGNIANANTPGYKARDVQPFSAAMDQAKLQMSATSPMHMGVEGTPGTATKVKKADSWDTFVSGNSVSVEQEMLKAGEVSRQHQLNTSITRSFHRMVLASVKGGA